MTFELQHSSLKAFLVPNHATVTLKLRGEEQALEDWEYRGFDDDKQFIFLTKNELQRWIPVHAISYIEQKQKS